jgi:uncharacterized protein (DUF1499 family)
VTYILGIIVTIIGLIIAVVYLPGHKQRLERIFSLPKTEATDFAKLRKNAKPNQYLVCPKNHCAELPDLIPRVYPVGAAKLSSTWHKIVMAAPDVTEQSRNNFIGSVDYIQRTSRMRYPDQISVQFFEQGNNQSTIAIYSRSIYGYSDKGVNKARVTAWLTRLDEALTP